MARADRGKDRKREGGKFSYEGLDRVLHEKARLGILTALVTQPKGVYFTDLKAQCVLTDGNLSRHLQVLHEAEIVEIWKGYEGKKPQTLIRMTTEGRKAFVRYLAELQRVIEDARGRPERASKQRFDAPPGFQPA